MNTSSRPVELFGLAFARISAGQAQLLDQWDQIRPVALERGAVAQVDPFERQVLDLLLDRRVGVRQEAAAERPRVLAETQVDARGLHDAPGIRHGSATIHSRATASRRRCAGSTPTPMSGSVAWPSLRTLETGVVVTSESLAHGRQVYVEAGQKS